MNVLGDGRLKRRGFLSAGLYALLLIPTVHVFQQASGMGADVSTLILSAWRPDFFEPLQSLGSPGNKIVVHGLLYLVIAVVAWVYFQAGRLWKMDDTAEDSKKNETQPVTFQQVFFWTAVFSVILLLVVPFHSKDIYGYINRGAQQAFYALNPYMHPLADVPNWETDPMFHAHWVNNPSPYGFFFNRLAMRLCSLSGGDFTLAFLLFKFNSLLLHLSVTYLVYVLGVRLNLSRPEFGALLYGWNPLMLLQMVGNGHNDLWVAFGVVLAVAMLRLVKWRWMALPLITISVLTKYASLLVVPFVLMALIRWRDWWALVIGTAVSVSFVVALGWPYLQDWQHLPFEAMVQNAGMTQHSLNSMLSRLVFYLGNVLPGVDLEIESLRSFFKPVLWFGFVLFFAVQCLRFWRTYQDRELNVSLIEPMALVMLVMIAIASSKFHAWYLGMFFPLLFLLDERSWVRRFGIMLSYFQLLAFTPLQNIHVLNYLLLTGVPLAWSLGLFRRLRRGGFEVQ